MKKYSVVIPTANRPYYLETALKSVSRQTVTAEIEEVLVSENLGCRDSEAICAKFPDLPIRYLFREPQLSNVDHIKALYLEARAPLIAMLCDDDWWGPSHLYLSGRALDDCPSASSWFSGFLYTVSETELAEISIWRPGVFWVGAGCPDVAHQWQLNFEKVASICWAVTPFHFSAMVARREALQEAISVWEGVHPYYADRILYPSLALHGDILFEPFSDTYVRWHPGNWLKDKKKEETDAAFKEGSEKIRRTAQENGCDVALIWRSLSKSIPKRLLPEISGAFRYAVSDSQLRDLGLAHFTAPTPAPKAVRMSRTMMRGVRRLAKELPKLTSS